MEVQKMSLNINDFSMDFFSLKGKNAIVTGGNSGLGQAFALALAKAGANIFAFAFVDDDGTTKKLIEDCGVKYTFMQGDLTEDVRQSSREVRRDLRKHRHLSKLRRHLQDRRRT